MKKYILILIASVLAFAITSCGVLVPNSVTVELTLGNNAPDTGIDNSSTLEIRDIVFVGFTEDNKVALKEDKSKQVTINWFGDGQRNFIVNYVTVSTPFGSVVSTETYGSISINLTNFENVKWYLALKPDNKQTISKLK